MSRSFLNQTTVPNVFSEDTSEAKPLPNFIGPYKIEGLLNVGGMSLLYLAVHPEYGKPVVVKALSPKYLYHKEMIGRFLREAEIIALTDHPNIVKLYGQGKWENGLYIAMEFIQGVSLRQFVHQKALSQNKVLEIILHVADALNHFHSHKIIHRDLKPENILITETGQIKVIDFGIAQLLGEDIEKNVHLMGTPSYMSPEQKDKRKATFSSDIYSLAIIAYELILGRYSGGIVHLSFLPHGLREIFEKALKNEPEERYRKIEDFAHDLSNYVSSSREDPSQIGSPNKKINFPEQLFITKTPSIPEIEIGFAIEKTSFSTAIYLDFFVLSQERLVVILLEPLTSAYNSFLVVSILRGMIRTLAEEFFQRGNKEIYPTAFIRTLNQLLAKDFLNDYFAMSLLMLRPREEKLSFISLSHNNLWHIPASSETPRILITPNAPLGQELTNPLLETYNSFSQGDLLILHSLEIDPYHSWIEEKSLFDETLTENRMLSSQQLAEKLLSKRIQKKPATLKRNAAILVIRKKEFTNQFQKG